MHLYFTLQTRRYIFESTPNSCDVRQPLLVTKFLRVARPHEPFRIRSRTSLATVITKRTVDMFASSGNTIKALIQYPKRKEYKYTLFSTYDFDYTCSD